MKELLEYRASLINRLVTATHEFRAACLAADDVFAPLHGGWNLHQIATQTRDVDKLVYGLRARRTVTESNPEFPSFDGDAYMQEHYSSNEPLSEILDDLVANVENLAQMLRGLASESWSRESRHATLVAGFTMQTWVERDLAHIEEHLGTIRKHKEL